MTITITRAEQMLTPAEVEYLTKIPAKTLSNWRYLGRGPAFVKDGGCIRYPVSSYEAWQAERLVATHV